MIFLDDDDDDEQTTNATSTVKRQTPPQQFPSATRTPSDILTARRLSSTPVATYMPETDPRVGSSRNHALPSHSDNATATSTANPPRFQLLCLVPSSTNDLRVPGGKVLFPVLTASGTMSDPTMVDIVVRRNVSQLGYNYAQPPLLPTPMRSLPDTQVLSPIIAQKGSFCAAEESPLFTVRLTFTSHQNYLDCVVQHLRQTETQSTAIAVRVVAESNGMGEGGMVSAAPLVLHPKEAGADGSKPQRLHPSDIIHISYTLPRSPGRSCNSFQIVNVSNQILAEVSRSSSLLAQALGYSSSGIQEMVHASSLSSSGNADSFTLNAVEGGTVTLSSRRWQSVQFPTSALATIWVSKLLSHRSAIDDRAISNTAEVSDSPVARATTRPTTAVQSAAGADTDNANEGPTMLLSSGRSSTLSLKRQPTSRKLHLAQELLDSTGRRSPTPVLDEASKLAALKRTSSVFRVPASHTLPVVDARTVPSTPLPDEVFPTPLMRVLTEVEQQQQQPAVLGPSVEGPKHHVQGPRPAIPLRVIESTLNSEVLPTSVTPRPPAGAATSDEQAFSITAMPRRSQPLGFSKLPDTLPLQPSAPTVAQVADSTSSDDDEDLLLLRDINNSRTSADESRAEPHQARPPLSICESGKELVISASVVLPTESVPQPSHQSSASGGIIGETPAVSTTHLGESYVSATVGSDSKSKTGATVPMATILSGRLYPGGSEGWQLQGESLMVITNSYSSSPQGPPSAHNEDAYNSKAPPDVPPLGEVTHAPMHATLSSRSLLPTTTAEQRGHTSIVVNVLTDTQGSTASNSRSARRVLFSQSLDQIQNSPAIVSHSPMTESRSVVRTDGENQTGLAAHQTLAGTKRPREDDDELVAVRQQTARSENINETLIVNAPSLSSLVGQGFQNSHQQTGITKDPFATPSPSQVLGSSTTSPAKPSAPQAIHSSMGSSSGGKESQFYRHLDSQIARALDRIQDTVQQSVPNPAGGILNRSSANAPAPPPPPPHFAPQQNLLIGNLFSLMPSAPPPAPPSDVALDGSPRKPSPSLGGAGNWESQQVYYNYQ